MIIKIKKFYCPLCGYEKVLDKNEIPPSICPACQDGKGKIYKVSPISDQELKDFNSDRD